MAPPVLPTWSSWRERSRPVETGGGTVAAYDLGPPDGQPLTFLHGYPSSSLDIAPVAAHLGAGWRIITLDLPGFGASPKDPGRPRSIHAAADAVEATWADRGVGATLLVAHDYGVSVGQELLARRHDGTLAVDVTGVVWMNGGLDPALHRPTIGQQLMLDPDHGAEVAAAIDEDTFTAGVAGTWGTRVPLDEHAVREMYRSMDDGGGVATMHELLHYIADRRVHADRWIAAVTAPTPPATLVWGDLDPVSGAHLIEDLAPRLAAGTRVVRLDDVGHWPPLEAPDVVAEEIRRAVSAPGGGA